MAKKKSTRGKSTQKRATVKKKLTARSATVTKTARKKKAAAKKKDAPRQQQAATRKTSSAGKAAKTKKSAPAKHTAPRTFTGMIRGRDRAVQAIAKALRELVCDEFPNVEESFHSGRNPLALYRTSGEVCWIQAFTKHCNMYFTRGTELNDPDGQLRGTSKRTQHVQLKSLADLDKFPLRAWLQESAELNAETIAAGVSFDDVLERLRRVCLALPETKETITWGRPHFRVGEKIFSGCGEAKGRVSIGMKAEPGEAAILLKLPGIEKAPYSRPNDGWISLDPAVFDDWDEIARLVTNSFRLIAPKRLTR